VQAPRCPLEPSWEQRTRPSALPTQEPPVPGRCRSPPTLSYLDGGHPNLSPHQDPAVLQSSHVRRLQLHEVGHQVGDVKLPVRTEQVAGLAPGPAPLGHKLGEDPHGGVLELQGAAPAPLLLLLLLLAVPRGPGGRKHLRVSAGQGGAPVPSLGTAKSRAPL
jgi:hypothetical protein